MDFIYFSIHVLFLFQDPIQVPHCIQFSCLPSLIWSVTVSQSLFSSPWQSWGILIRCPGEYFPICVGLMFFSLDWGYEFLERISQKCPSHHMIRFLWLFCLFRVLQMWPLLLVNLKARLFTFHSYPKGNPLSKVSVRNFTEDFSWWKMGEGKEKVAWHITQHKLMKIPTNINVSPFAQEVQLMWPLLAWKPPPPPAPTHPHPDPSSSHLMHLYTHHLVQQRPYWRPIRTEGTWWQ